MLSGLFSISWARTAPTPILAKISGSMHAYTHLADKQARVCECLLLMYVLYFVVIGHLTRM